MRKRVPTPSRAPGHGGRGRIRTWRDDAAPQSPQDASDRMVDAEHLFRPTERTGPEMRDIRRMRGSLLRERAHGLGGAAGYDLKRHLRLARAVSLLIQRRPPKQNGARKRTPT